LTVPTPAPSTSLILSALLFAVAVLLAARSRGGRIFSFLVGCTALVYVLLTAVWVVSDSFTADGINQAVIYHLRYGFAGAGFSAYSGLIIGVAVFCALGAVFVVWIFRRTATAGKTRIGVVLAAALLLAAATLVHPASSDIAGLLAGGDEAGDFRRYYRSPYAVETGGKPRNVVFIYGEGLERTYFDDEVFPGLMTGLGELEGKSTSFTGLRQTTGAGWTIGGLVASQCGIPLSTPSHGNSMLGMDEFLGNAVCLGDLLEKKGYTLAYYGGADLLFAGKGKFFSTHGFTEVKGKRELRPTLPEAYKASPWGLYDDTLLDIAFRRFTELAQAGEPFGLFLLTLDTHPPRGDPSRSCDEIRYRDGSNAMLNSVACSDYLLSDFVKRIIESPYGDDTVVVLVSDHLSMRNTAWKQLKKSRRTNLFMVVDPLSQSPAEIARPGTTLDVGPTVLPFLGFEGPIGLGRDLRGEEDSLVLQVEGFGKRLKSWQGELQAFWGFPKISGGTRIDPERREIAIAGRTFRFPVLVELNDNLETVLKFQFGSDSSHKRLADHVRQMKEGTPFLWIDECRAMTFLNPGPGGREHCLVTAVAGEEPVRGEKLSGPVKIPVRELKALAAAGEEVRGRPRSEPAPVERTGFEALRVAHAGGGVGGETYTNSYDALNLSLEKGFTYFEIDLSFTSDGELVCIHDWKDSFTRSFGTEAAERPDLAAFESLVLDRSKYRKCTLAGLAEWLERNPAAVLVTDVKEDNLRALRMVSERVRDSSSRVIPQVYDPRNYDAVREMGYRSVIWTLYRFSGSDEDVLRRAEGFDGPFAVTMTRKRAKGGLPDKLAKRGVPTYVHTVNKPAQAKKFMERYGVTEIYTDHLAPGGG
jgi:phosphoglycerol transferase